MEKEVITSKQAIALMILFVTNGSLIFPTGVEAKKDLWIAILIGMTLGIIISLIYTKLLCLFPGRDIYDIFIIIFGKIIGRILCILYVLFSFTLTTLVLEDFGAYITTVTLPEMPLLLILIFPVALCMYALKGGIEIMGRFSELVYTFLILIGILTILLLTPKMDIRNILPIFENGISPILQGSFSIFAFPFGETVIFTAIFSSLQSKKDIGKSYVLGILIGGLLVSLAKFSDVLVLGIERFSQFYFPAYASVSRVQVGEFIQRIEISFGLIFTITTFMKFCICMLSTVLGTAKVLNIKDYRFIVIPICLLVLNCSFIFNKDIIELTNWTVSVWRYFSFPFEVIIPIIALITAKTRNKRKPIHTTK